MRPEDLYNTFHEIDDDLLKPLPEAAPRRVASTWASALVVPNPTRIPPSASLSSA